MVELIQLATEYVFPDLSKCVNDFANTVSILTLDKWPITKSSGF